MKVPKIIWRILVGSVLVVMALPPVRLFYFSLGVRWCYILLFSVMASYFFTPICSSLAFRLDILDRPGGRKIHQDPTPLLGGVAICLAFSLSLLLNGVFLPGMKIMLVGAALIFVMGLWDDVSPLRPLVKLTLQVVITLGVVAWGDIRLTFFSHYPWAPFVNIPLTVLWMVGLTNALNFFDGLDGLATGISTITAFFLGMMAFESNQPALGWLAIALMGACVGFIPFNLRIGKPALIFLGDAGSTFLGFTLAGLAVLGEWSANSHFVSLTAPVLIFGVLIFDMLYVTLSRALNSKSGNLMKLLMTPGRDHLHHRLLFMGFSAKEAAFTIFTVSACLGVSALIIMDQNFIDALLGLFQAAMILATVAILMIKGRERV